MENANVLRRLKTIEGHLKGVVRMVEEDSYCIDVIRQIQAVEAALNKVSSQILENHLNSCVITAIQGEDAGERRARPQRDHRSLRNVEQSVIPSGRKVRHAQDHHSKENPS